MGYLLILVGAVLIAVVGVLISFWSSHRRDRQPDSRIARFFDAS